MATPPSPRDASGRSVTPLPLGEGWGEGPTTTKRDSPPPFPFAPRPWYDGLQRIPGLVFHQFCTGCRYLGKADLHVHSSVSDGMASVADIMSFTQEETDLDLIAIADHDQVEGSLAAVEWVRSHPGCRTQAVVATEITAALGRHLLAYFFRPPYPTEPFPRGKSYQHTIGLVHEMGGLVGIPHPTVMWTPSGGYRHILWLLGAGVRIDGIEVCNAAIGARGNAEKIRTFNRRDFHMGELGGSDAHHLAQIGSAFTFFKGRSPLDFERSLLHRKTKARFGEAGTVTVQEHLRQVFKSWVEKPTRGLRATLANR